MYIKVRLIIEKHNSLLKNKKALDNIQNSQAGHILVDYCICFAMANFTMVPCILSNYETRRELLQKLKEKKQVEFKIADKHDNDKEIKIKLDETKKNVKQIKIQIVKLSRLNKKEESPLQTNDILKSVNKIILEFTSHIPLWGGEFTFQNQKITVLKTSIFFLFGYLTN